MPESTNTNYYTCFCGQQVTRFHRECALSVPHAEFMRRSAEVHRNSKEGMK
jgi:hypothetical protein